MLLSPGPLTPKSPGVPHASPTEKESVGEGTRNIMIIGKVISYLPSCSQTTYIVFKGRILKIFDAFLLSTDILIDLYWVTQDMAPPRPQRTDG